MAVQIQLRRGTAAEWTTANPILAAGEAGVETDTGKLKLGDGSTAWTSLSYVAGSDGTVTWADVTGKPATFAPSAHAASHGSGGSDALTLAQSQVTGLVTALAGKEATGTAAAAVAAHEAASDPHPGYVLNAELTGHEADTTNVHGIADTSALVLTSDSRLSDARTPTAHASSHATAGSDPIAPADIGAAAASHTHPATAISDSTTAGRALLTAADAAAQRAAIGAGTVSSVGLSVSGAIHSVSGSPVTSSGTLTLGLLNQAANRVFAGPASGADAAPAFRALVEADVPFRTLRRYAGLIQEDFIAGIGPGLSFSNNGSGAGSTNADNANLDLGGFPGWLVMTTGTTNTGRTAITPSASGPIVLGSGAWHHEALVRLPAVSDGTETFVVVSGFNDSPEPATAATDGVYFRYSHGDNGGRWQCICRSNSVETVADSGITVAATTNYRLQIEINAAGTSAEFLINGTSVATIGTNIPVGVPRYTRWLPAGIGKTAGTTARTLLVDYIETWCTLTAAR